MDHATNAQHQSDSDALASALGAIGAAGVDDDVATAHQFGDYTHDASTGHKLEGGGDDEEGEDQVDITGLEDVMQAGDDDDDDIDLSVLDAGDLDDTTQRGYGRPPSIRKGGHCLFTQCLD